MYAFLRGASNEYPQHMFYGNIRKTIPELSSSTHPLKLPMGISIYLAQYKYKIKIVSEKQNCMKSICIMYFFR